MTDWLIDKVRECIGPVAAKQVSAALEAKDKRIAELEAKIEKLQRDGEWLVADAAHDEGDLRNHIAALEAAHTEAVHAEKRIWVDALLENLPEEKAVLFRDICVSAEKLRAARAALEGKDD